MEHALHGRAPASHRGQTIHLESGRSLAPRRYQSRPARFHRHAPRSSGAETRMTAKRSDPKRVACPAEAWREHGCASAGRTVHTDRKENAAETKRRLVRSLGRLTGKMKLSAPRSARRLAAFARHRRCTLRDPDEPVQRIRARSQQVEQGRVRRTRPCEVISLQPFTRRLELRK